MVTIDIKSESIDGKYYTVVYGEYSKGIAVLDSCTCPDFKYRRAESGEMCKHLATVKHAMVELPKKTCVICHSLTDDEYSICSICRT